MLKNNKASGRDDVLVEQVNKLGPKAYRWLLTMLNKCFMENKITTLWRQSKIIAILKPGRTLRFQRVTDHYPFCVIRKNSMKE